MSRVEGLSRLLYIVPLILFNYLTLIVSIFIFIPIAVIDIIWHITTGNNVFGDLTQRWFMWHISNTLFILTGNTDWSWTP